MFRASLIMVGLMWPAAGLAQEAATTQELYAMTQGQVSAAQNQDRCISQMAEFPTDDPTARYQFFKLVSDVGYGADSQTKALFDHYGQPAVEAGTPVLSVIEDIANPVLRQAAPEVIVSSMNYLVDFAAVCDVYITGQTDSLIAFAVWGNAAQSYSSSLVAQRDAVEFAAFETDIAELETLFMDDLDGRLARSNDVINSEMDREILGDAVKISDDMNEAARKRAKQERLYNLIRILGGGR
jgi:uncharacterized FlaG/YvyC family protein